MITLLLAVILILVVGISVAFVSSSKTVRKANGLDGFPSLSFDSQILYRPVRSLRRSIEDIVQSSSDPAVRAMNSSVTDEVRDAHDRVVQALQTRDQLRKAIEGYVRAQSEAARLEDLRDAAATAQEKLSYTKALEAKNNELAEYAKAKAIIKKIEHEIEMTQASLSELKAKLTVSSAATDAAERADDLRSSLGSLDAIQSSVREAQDILHT